MGNRKIPKGFVSLGTCGNTLNKDIVKETQHIDNKTIYITKDGNSFVVERVKKENE